MRHMSDQALSAIRRTHIASLFAVLLLATAAMSQPPAAKFTSASLQAGYFPTGTALESMASGDFNGDGKIDLLIAGGGSNCPLAIWLGNGDGTFTPSVSTDCIKRNAYDGTGVHAPTLLAVGDFNGDGHLDFTVFINGSGGSGTNYLDVYLGDGAGGFSFSNSYSVGIPGLGGPYNQAVVAGDVNADGKLDLVAVDGWNDNTITVFLGNGDGTFQPGAVYPACNLSGCTANSLSLGDFNGDGHPDVAIATNGTSQGAGISILLNSGTGSFGTPLFYAGSSPIGEACCGDSNPDVVAADLRGNGKIDAVLTGSAGAWVFLGNGDGTLQPGVSYSVPFADSIAVADINGDKKPDLIASDFFESAAFVLLGNGDGTFKPAAGYTSDWTPQSVVIADFNGDKKLDFATGNDSGPFVSVFLGNGDGTFRAGANYDANQPWSAPEVMADFNNDGNLDIALDATYGAGQTTINLMLGSSHGVLGAPIVISPASGTYSIGALAAGDVNGDGKADLVAGANMGGGSYDIQVFLGKGNGTFAAPVLYSTGDSDNPGPLVLADVNGDGKLDVLVSNEDGSLSVLLNKGKGVFATAKVIAGVTTSWEWLAAGDFNGDGKTDIVLADSGNNTVNVLLGNGNGTFQPAVKYPVQNGPQFIAVASLRGNGVLDLITGGYGVGSGNGGGGGIAILLGNGDGTFGATTYYNPYGGGIDSNVNPLSAAVADVNLDGKPDVIVTFDSEHTGPCCPISTPYNIGLGIFLGNGDGTLTYQAPPPVGTATPYIVGAGSQYVLAGDFNSDGAMDAAVLNLDNGGSGNSVTILLNTTAPVSVSPLQIKFAAQTVGTISRPQTVLLTNNQTSALTISGVSLGGSDPGDFTETSACPKSLAAGAHCSITVKFTPTATGSRSATLSIKDALGTQSVNLSGTGK